jgi:hypothetical protein
MYKEEEFLAVVRASAREDERFFSNAAKAERELWVVREFLNSLEMPFEDSEFTVTPQYSDADVLFRDARFQVKEIAEPGIQRHAEFRSYRLRAESATCIEDLVEPTEARDIILSNAYLLIFERASSLRYAPAVKANLDLLCYVTRPYSGLGTEEERRQLERTGWHSISCLYGTRALVLSPAVNAPPFLRGSMANQTLGADRRITGSLWSSVHYRQPLKRITSGGGRRVAPR